MYKILWYDSFDNGELFGVLRDEKDERNARLIAKLIFNGLQGQKRVVVYDSQNSQLYVLET